MRDTAAQALASLAEEKENCAIIADAGAIEPLVAHLSVGGEPGRSAAALCFKNLCQHEPNVERVGVAGAVPPLVQQLASSSSLEVRSSCAGAVMALSGWSENRREIIACGGIQPLVELLQTPNLPGTGKSDAENALCRLVMDPNADKDCDRNPMVVPVLVDLVKSGGDSVKELAAHAIADLAEYSTRNQEVLGKSGAIDVLVATLKAPSPTLVSAASKALIELAFFRPNRLKADQCGAVAAITDLLIKGQDIRVSAPCTWLLPGSRLPSDIPRPASARRTAPWVPA